MAGRWKSTSILSSFPSLLLEAWNKWDVRGMILFSLILQITLFLLGMCRKRTINHFNKTILWFAYLGADWIAIASLGKLSCANAESPTINVLRAYWAPLLILHLGGPDTITAYAFEDNKLWIRHLLILSVKAILVIYVICLSWTSSWISFLNFPLFLAGITKYVERILCLKLNSSQKTKPILSIFNFRDSNIRLPNDPFVFMAKENGDVLRGYLLFTVLRPDVNDYLSHDLHSSKIRIESYLKEIADTNKSIAKSLLFDLLSDPEIIFSKVTDIVAIELGFIFDVVYTKAALIYTKSGCLLRFTSIACSISVMLIFFINIMNEPKFHLPRVDASITCILLGGTIALELYAAWVMLSSDWAILVVELHHSALVREVFRVVLKFFACFLHQRKRWSGSMGQFDLLEYCWHYKKKEAGILQKITSCSDIIEMWHKQKFTDFVDVPSYLELPSTYAYTLQASVVPKTSLKALMGERALMVPGSLKWTIESDFDYSILIWHLATSVLFYRDKHFDSIEKKSSKCASDYMMYLLAMRTTLLLPEHSKSFWLDHTCNELKILFAASDKTNPALILIDEENGPLTSELTLKSVQEDVRELVSILDKESVSTKWEMISGVWIEMLLHAALSTEHVSHVKHLGEGIEFLSFLWLLGIFEIANKCANEDAEDQVK